MIYKIGMLCKHFKGKDLYEKNIYRIVDLNVDGKKIDVSKVTYSGDGDMLSSNNLVVYANIFQNNKLFARDYEDISSELTEEKKNQFNQTIKVQPLTQEEILIVNSDEFVIKKLEIEKQKHKEI